MKTYFIVSDIHSQYEKLMLALKKNNFDIDDENHIFVFGGDALDRGDEGDLVIKFFETLITKKRIIGVLGNHDKFLLDLINGDISKVNFNILHNGFRNTLSLGIESNEYYLSEQEVIESGKIILNKYPLFVQWLKTLPAFIEFNHHILVHGFLDFSLDDWHNTKIDYAIWTRGHQYELPKTFNKYLIFGHTPNQVISGNNDIIFDKKKIMIDGGATYGGKINVLKINEKDI